MKRMQSIGPFAKETKVTPRTIRLYEKMGFITSAGRSENGYRFFDDSMAKRVLKIRKFQKLGFSLDEIKDILEISTEDLVMHLQRKLVEVESDQSKLETRRQRIMNLLSIGNKVVSIQSVNEIERKQFMEHIRNEVIAGIKMRAGTITENQIQFLSRDRDNYSNDQSIEFMQAVKKCVDFAKTHNLRLGAGRGSSSSSITLFGLGFNTIDPSKYNLLPERLSGLDLNLHIDVEFERGQIFVDYCKDVSSKLKHGNIEAFKMPLIDILNNVDKLLSNPIDLSKIDDESDDILECFRTGNIDKVFMFDWSKRSIIVKTSNYLPEYTGIEKKRDYLINQKIHNFRDVMNVWALWRPNSQDFVDRIYRYRDTKNKKYSYPFLSAELKQSLKPNFGLVLYHEDLIRIIHDYTNWSYGKCNLFRRQLFLKEVPDQNLLVEFQKTAPREVVSLVLEEAKFTFCQPHAIAFSQFVKHTSYLKSKHPKIYIDEIDKWEQKNGFCWDDIGFKIKGMSVLQN